MEESAETTILNRLTGAILITGLAFAGSVQGESTPERPDKPPAKERIIQKTPEPLQKLTVHSKPRISKFERDFGCNIQEGETKPTPRQEKCIQAIAAVLGQNSFGWQTRQADCLEELWTRESSWSSHADNPKSSAYGIPQALTSYHTDTLPGNFETNAVAQVQWGLEYIEGRYDSPCGALAFWHRQDEIDGANWY